MKIKNKAKTNKNKLSLNKSKKDNNKKNHKKTNKKINHPKKKNKNQKSNFYKVDKYSNIKIVICYRQVFDLERLNKNCGSYIILIIFFYLYQ